MSFEVVAKQFLKKPALVTPPKLLLHPADTLGCGHYRIIQPAEALLKTKDFLPIASLNYIQAKEFFSFNPSHLVTQRQWHLPQLKHLQEYKKYNKNLQFVLDIDDLIWLSSGKGRHRPDQGMLKVFKEILFLADQVVCSTPVLQRMLKATYGIEAFVLPNMIQGAFYRKPGERTSERLRVAWAGASFHQDDLAILKRVVLGTVDLVDWLFIGDAPKDIEPFSLRIIKDWIPPAKWVPFLGNLFIDLAVAPLRSTAFNNAKSNLRHLEWNAVGVPVIASKIAPYLQNRGPLIEPLQDTKKEADLWIEVIREMANNEPLRMALAQDSFAQAARFNLEGNLPLIKAAWKLPLEKLSPLLLH